MSFTDDEFRIVVVFVVFILAMILFVLYGGDSLFLLLREINLRK